MDQEGLLLLLLDWEDNWLHLLRRYLGQHHDLSSQSIQSGLKGGRWMQHRDDDDDNVDDSGGDDDNDDDYNDDSYDDDDDG